MRGQAILPRLTRRALLGGAAVLPAGHAWAAATMRVQISGVGATRVPVAVRAFSGDSTADDAFAAVLQADFLRGGVLAPQAWPADAAGQGTAAVHGIVAGSVAKLADGRLEVRWTFDDPLRPERHIAQAVLALPADRRLAAHRIADEVERVLTGVRGAHASRIAYVVQQGGRHLLKVADADGHHAQVVLASRQALISPAWSPDGRELAYVSFEGGQARVWVQTVQTGQRRVLAAWRGSNSAPAWSPDGQRLAVALSRDGLTQVYLVDRQGGTPQRLTRSQAIDTEPCWSHDGRQLYFVSDRGGSPQIYRSQLDGSGVERVSFGAHCVSPSLSPDGRHLAYISREQGALRVTLRALDSGAVRQLTDTRDDERPSFSPNGRLLAYATRQGGRDQLFTTSLDGLSRLPLPSLPGDVREPAWGPWVPGAPA